MASPGSIAAKLVRGKVARFTLLDQCGMPVASNSSFVTEGLITVKSTKNVDAGDEIKTRLMNGRLGQYEPGKATVTNFTLDINFVGIDTAALTMLTGDPAILDAAALNIVGWEELALAKQDQHWAMELWTDTSGNFCQAGGKVVGYMLYPFISQSYITLDDITDKEVTAHVMGMSYGNPDWGKGPYGTGTAPGRTVTDGVLNATTTVTSATAAFVSGDVGATITGTGIPTGATIVTVSSTTSVVISIAATVSSTAVHLTIGAGDGSSVSGPVAGINGLAARLAAVVNPAAHRHFELTSIAPPAPTTPAGPESITLPNPY